MLKNYNKIDKKVAISVLIPVYNGEKVIETCITSVLASSIEDYEVLIIDDCSSDASIAKLKRYLSDKVLLIRNNRNKGFVKTIKIGIKRARGDIIVLLNMDTIVERNWLEELVKPLYNCDNTGITGSKIYYIDGVTIQHAGGFLDEIARSYHVGRGEVEHGQYDMCSEVEYVCGASLAFRKELLEKIGELDSGFSPAYYEEADFAMRSRRAGYKILYVPASKLRHYECYSTMAIFFYYISKNRLRFAIKHYPVKKLIGAFIKGEMKFFMENDIANRKKLLKAYFYTLFRLPEIILVRLKERIPHPHVIEKIS